MKPCLRLFLSYLVLSFIAFTNLYGQAKETKGTLLRVPFDAQEIDLSNTVGSWFHQSGFEYNSYSKYTLSFSLNNDTYLLKDYYDNSIYVPTYGIELEWVALQNTISLYDHYGYLDIIEPYMFNNSFIQVTEKGAWIVNGVEDVSFYSINRELFKEGNDSGSIIHIPGRIMDNYLIVVRDIEPYSGHYDYFIADLKNSPEKNLLQQIKVRLQSGGDVFNFAKLNAINDSLYFTSVSAENNYTFDSREMMFSISYLNDTTLTILENQFENENLTHWSSFGNRITGLRNGNLIGQTLDIGTLRFENIDTLAKNISKYSLSVDENFSAFYKNDSLFVFSLENETLINSWSLDGIHRRNSPLIDSPYVYIQQITTVVGVEDADELPKKFTLSQNYPNPFNPTTTIKFTIPKVETPYKASLQTKLIIFDILGKEVKTLLNKPMQPGGHQIEFDGTNLSSGIYFYVLETGGKKLSRKMLLIK